MGLFAGSRLRIALGHRGSERVRAGIAIAPTLHRMGDGGSRLRIGEGLEYGLTDRRSPAVAIAGYRISELQRFPKGPHQNVSTVGWVAIGVGVVVLAGVGAMAWLIHEANENTE
jgi:hypothetical protein